MILGCSSPIANGVVLKCLVVRIGRMRRGVLVSLVNSCCLGNIMMNNIQQQHGYIPPWEENIDVISIEIEVTSVE